MLSSLRTLSRNERILLGIALLLIIGLGAKFLWPLFAFDLPLGYDVGFYRYLFIKHAQGFPPFIIADLEPWARGHPLGLFIFTSLLMHLGVSADWLIGWIWNLFPIVLVTTLAGVMRKRHGAIVGVCTLLAALLSVAYFDGFAAMYWKTFVALFWFVLAVHACEKKSWLCVPFGILTVVTHSQTGLLFGLVFASWIALKFISLRKSNEKLFDGIGVLSREMIVMIAAGMVIVGIALLIYAPVWNETVTQILPLLFKHHAPGGNFPSATYFMRIESILLLLGMYGFIQSVRKERWTPWQLAVVWSLLFIVFRLIFYRRFFLQLDFFLMPFAAIGIADSWTRLKDWKLRGMLVLILSMQFLVTVQAISLRSPVMDDETFHVVQHIETLLPDDAYVLGLENETVGVLRGWMITQRVGGPGLFDSVWSYEDWEKFLLGSHEDRVRLIATLPKPAYMFVSPYFRDFYGEHANIFLTDTCFVSSPHPMLYKIECPDTMTGP